MSNEQDLLKQLKSLPDEAQAPDRWQAIQQQIEADKIETVQKTTEPSRRRGWWPMAIAACALLVAVIASMFIGDEQAGVSSQLVTIEKQPDKTYQLTIESLQQANAAYYAELGQIVSNEPTYLAPATWESLFSLRKAQQQYRQALAEKPQNARVQERLFWLYQKERELLRRLMA